MPLAASGESSTGFVCSGTSMTRSSSTPTAATATGGSSTLGLRINAIAATAAAMASPPANANNPSRQAMLIVNNKAEGSSPESIAALATEWPEPHVR